MCGTSATVADTVMTVSVQVGSLRSNETLRYCIATPTVRRAPAISQSTEPAALASHDPPTHIPAIHLNCDGWVFPAKDATDELLFWIPWEHWNKIILPYRTIIGGDSVGLDLSKFARGTDWTKCYTPLESSDSAT